MPCSRISLIGFVVCHNFFAHRHLFLNLVPFENSDTSNMVENSDTHQIIGRSKEKSNDSLVNATPGNSDIHQIIGRSNEKLNDSLVNATPGPRVGSASRPLSS